MKGPTYLACRSRWYTGCYSFMTHMLSLLLSLLSSSFFYLEIYLRVSCFLLCLPPPPSISKAANKAALVNHCRKRVFILPVLVLCTDRKKQESTRPGGGCSFSPSWISLHTGVRSIVSIFAFWCKEFRVKTEVSGISSGTLLPSHICGSFVSLNKSEIFMTIFCCRNFVEICSFFQYDLTVI